MCLGTNVSVHNRIWAQTCLGTNVSGHKRDCAQSCLGTNMSGHKRVWAQSCMGTNVVEPLLRTLMTQFFGKLTIGIIA